MAKRIGRPGHDLEAYTEKQQAEILARRRKCRQRYHAKKEAEREAEERRAGKPEAPPEPLPGDLPQPGSHEVEAARQEIERAQSAVGRKLELVKARDDLIRFTELTMPHPEDPEEFSLSRYQAAKHHHVKAAALEAVERGEILRLLVMEPPRMGKTELVCKRFIPWFIGRDPYRSVIYGTYGEILARDVGRDVREVMKSERYKSIFPGVGFRKGGASVTDMETTEGGNLYFVGRGGGVTGRGGDLLLVDDPLKDAEEAASPTIREQAWTWLMDTFHSRMMTDMAAIIIIATRWHDDDPMGRLIDPSNPCYDSEEAKNWRMIKLPFFAEHDDPLGRAEGQVLWPERFSKRFGEEKRRLRPRSFAALYQQRPAPEEGTYFKREWCKLYSAHDRPPLEDLRIYAASDHAVGTDKKKHDATVMIVAGVDKDKNIWLLHIWWKHAGAAEQVDAMVSLIKHWRPIRWWAEKGHITKSLGPFLIQRLMDESLGNPVEDSPTGNTVGANEQRPQSIRAAMEVGLVHFPKGNPHLMAAIDELMKFPDAGRNDDFVSALAHLGMGLHRMPGKGRKKQKATVKPYTMGWMVKETRRMERERRAAGQLEW